MFPRCLSTAMRQALQHLFMVNQAFSRLQSLHSPALGAVLPLPQSRLKWRWSKGQGLCGKGRRTALQKLCWTLLPLSPRILAIEQWGSCKEKLLPRSRGRSGCTEERREKSVVIAFPFPNTVWNSILHRDTFQVTLHTNVQQDCSYLINF